MEMIRELDQCECNALKEKHRGHPHIEPVLNKAYCYRVNLFAQDYHEIFVCSGFPHSRDQPIAQAIEHIKGHQNFLAESANWHSSKGKYSGRLSGKRVQKYLMELNACKPRLQNCFMKMGDCFVSNVSDKRRNEVKDGMHRLVAYGLVTDLKDDHFPISIYFGTDETL